jgi:hypothetical protein
MADEPVVLMVDDDLSLTNTFIAGFYLAGYRVVTAGTLEEGREAILREERLDLAILDMRIRIGRVGSSFDPDDFEQTNGGQLSGLFLGRFILEHRPGLPFIGLSVRADEDCRKWFEEHGAGFLTKYAALGPKGLLSFVAPRLRKSVLANRDNRATAPGARVVTTETSVRAQELQFKLARLEREYELARVGLRQGERTTAMSMGTLLIIMILAYAAGIWGSVKLMDGTQLVIVVAIMTIALVAYAAMIFGRAARIKARLTQTEKELEMVLGEDVRSKESAERS